MLNAYSDTIQAIAFVYAHAGLKEDEDNRIYSLAAAVIEPDAPKKTFASYIRYSLLTAREKYDSGISKTMLEDAPPAEAVGQRLKDFLKNQPFVFVLDNHNIAEDLRNLCGDIRIIDLGFAAEFFLPHLESYTLRRIWEHVFGKPRDKIFFTAEEVADLSAELVKHICGNPLSDRMNPRAPALRYYLKKSDTLFGEAFLHIAQNYRKYFGGLFDSCTVPDTENWKQFLEKAEKISRNRKKKQGIKKISGDHLETLYRGMADADKAFAFRPEQAAYARHIGSALNDHAVLTIEAGTGTGKTQGYLVPAMEFLYRNRDARVMVSTYTKSLQQQIFGREVRFVKEMFKIYQDIPAAMLKGKSSYICAEKLDHVYDEALTGKRLLTWLWFVNIAFHFRETDRDAAGEKIKSYLGTDFYFHQTLTEISAKDGCTPKHTRCPAQVVTAEARDARLVITNHHKLALLDNDSLLSGLFRNYIIDEANHFENAVRAAFGAEVNSYEMGGIIRSLEPGVRRILPRAAGNLLKEIENALAAMDMVRHLIKDIRQSLIAMNPGIRSGQVNELQYHHPGFQKGQMDRRMDSLQIALLEIGRNLKLIKDPDLCRMLKLQAKTIYRIKTAVLQLEDFADALNTVKDGLVSSDKVSSYQCFSKNWILAAQSVEVADLIRNHIYTEKDSIVYTAATLCHRGNFDNFREIAGMDKPLTREDGTPVKEFRFEMIPSPFCKDAMEIIVPKTAVNGKFDNKDAWVKMIAEILPELIEKNKGRTLVLFSSYSDLNLIAERIAASATTYPLLIQQQGQPTVNLCDEFREIRESVLFGVDTFWYGVDFKGDTLTQVIITRIPYPSPFEPIQIARKKLMSPKAYWSRYYYDTEIKMKQGIGRLIRCDTDRGKVVILDSRYRREIEN